MQYYGDIVEQLLQILACLLRAGHGGLSSNSKLMYNLLGDCPHIFKVFASNFMSLQL